MALKKELLVLVIIVVAALIDKVITKNSKSKTTNPETSRTRTCDTECPECNDCGAGKYKCLDGTTCITPKEICDKTEHCGDGEDEKNCPVIRCDQLPKRFELVSDNNEIGSTAEIVCPSGTSKTCGNTIITCQNDGTWSDATGISCYIPTGGNILSGGYLSVSQSSTHAPVGDAVNAVDNDPITCSETAGGDNPAFWEVKLKERRQIDRIAFVAKPVDTLVIKITLDGQDCGTFTDGPLTGSCNGLCGQMLRIEKVSGATALQLCEVIF